MRRLIVSTIVSVDGYHEGDGGDVSVMPFDDGFSAYNVERLRDADTLLLARTSYEAFTAYWPPVQHDPEQPEVEREISRLNTAIHKVVVSDTLDEHQDGAFGPTTVVRLREAHQHVAELKAQEGRDILVFGSNTLWNDLLDDRLVDELHLLVGPALVGSGTPAFTQRPRTSLRLLEARRLPDSQLVLLRYAAS